MPITKIAHSSFENERENYINILRAGQSVTDTGWTTYSDSAGVNPVDGIGGTATVTWSQNTSNPLSGDADLRLVKDASNRQGDGVSIPFTIANRHLAKVLQISFDMELISGTYSTGDLRVSIIQDPSGTPVMLEPVGTNLELGIANQRMREIATFQTHVSVTSYRLCIHVSSTSASAYTVDFANFRVWEQQQSLGSVITDPVAYTPTFVGMSPTGLSFTWQRIGKNIRIMGRGTIASNSSTQWSFTTPNGIVPDFGYTSGEGIQVGTITRGAASDGNLLSLLGRNDNLIRFGGYLALNSGSGPLAWNTWNPFGSGEIFNLTVEFPVLGWGSNVAMSSDSGDGRLVAFSTSGVMTITMGANVTFKSFPSIAYDTHSVWNNTTGIYTVPVSGIYNVNVQYTYHGDSSFRSVGLYKNGSFFRYIFDANSTFGNAGSTDVQCNAGETLSIAFNSTGSGNAVCQGITIKRISAGSQVIATQETVVAVAIKTTGSITVGSIITWTSKEIDTHNSLDIATGEFTCPIAGRYLVVGRIMESGGFSNAEYGVSLRKNGTQIVYSTLYIGGVTIEHDTTITHILNCIAGDKISLYGYGSGSYTPSNGSINITRLGI